MENNFLQTILHLLLKIAEKICIVLGIRAFVRAFRKYRNPQESNASMLRSILHGCLWFSLSVASIVVGNLIVHEITKDSRETNTVSGNHMHGDYVRRLFESLEGKEKEYPDLNLKNDMSPYAATFSMDKIGLKPETENYELLKRIAQRKADSLTKGRVKIGRMTAIRLVAAAGRFYEAEIHFDGYEDGEPIANWFVKIGLSNSAPNSDLQALRIMQAYGIDPENSLSGSSESGQINFIPQD